MGRTKHTIGVNVGYKIMRL